MIIDGKNAIDEYNMYNIINQSFENVDDADFTYSGIAMEEYFDESNEDDLDDMNVEVQLSDQSAENEELVEDAIPAGDDILLNREWLQDIGIDK